MNATSTTQMPPNEVNAQAMPGESAKQAKPSMAAINFWLDAALFVTIIGVMWVTILLQFVFPTQAAATAGWRLWGLSFDQWRNVQFIGLCTFALLAIEHLVLHWNWVCSILATRILRARTRPDEGSQAIYGVGTFIVILVLTMGTLLAATFTIQAPR